MIVGKPSIHQPQVELVGTLFDFHALAGMGRCGSAASLTGIVAEPISLTEREIRKMSVGHRTSQEPKSLRDLQLVLGEADTSQLYAKAMRARVITSHDVPYGGGAACDASELYVDQQLYKELLHDPGAPRHMWITIRGLEGKQAVRLILRHEGCEIAIELGDNPVDIYSGCHAFAITDEEERALPVLLGKGQTKRYNDGLEPGLRRCLQRSINRIRAGIFNPPKQLWCGPYLDDPGSTDLILLRGLRACNVTDAFKKSKADPKIMYGVGGRQCRDCKMMEKPKLELSPCELVSGRVRWNRQCLRYVER